MNVEKKESPHEIVITINNRKEYEAVLCAVQSKWAELLDESIWDKDFKDDDMLEILSSLVTCLRGC